MWCTHNIPNFDSYLSRFISGTTVSINKHLNTWQWWWPCHLQILDVVILTYAIIYTVDLFYRLQYMKHTCLEYCCYIMYGNTSSVKISYKKCVTITVQEEIQPSGDGPTDGDVSSNRLPLFSLWVLNPKKGLRERKVIHAVSRGHCSVPAKTNQAKHEATFLEVFCRIFINYCLYPVILLFSGYLTYVNSSWMPSSPIYFSISQSVLQISNTHKYYITHGSYIMCT